MSAVVVTNSTIASSSSTSRTDVVEVHGDVGGAVCTDESRFDERREPVLHVECRATLVVLHHNVTASHNEQQTVFDLSLIHI